MTYREYSAPRISAITRSRMFPIFATLPAWWTVALPWWATVLTIALLTLLLADWLRNNNASRTINSIILFLFAASLLVLSEVCRPFPSFVEVFSQYYAVVLTLLLIAVITAEMMVQKGMSPPVAWLIHAIIIAVALVIFWRLRR